MKSLPFPNKNSTLLLIFLIVLSVCIHRGTFLLLDAANAFKIKKVNISGLELADTASLRGLIARLYEQSLTDLDINQLNNNLLQQPLIASSVTERDFPYTVKISIQERKPVAEIHYNNEMLVIDKTGKILPLVPNKSTPQIVTDFGLIVNNDQILDEFLLENLPALELPTARQISSLTFMREKGLSFRLDGLSSDFLIGQRILNQKFITRALEIKNTIISQQIVPPAKIDIHSDENAAIGFR